MNDYTIYFDIDDTLSKYVENLKSSGLSAKDTARDLDFWLNAPVMDGATELFKFCKDNFKNVEILSTVPFHSKEKFEETGEVFYPNPIKGKIEWVTKHFGNVKFNWTKNGKDKAKFANNKSVLIDDKLDNVKHFSNNGIGILFKNSNQVLEELKELIKKNPLNEGLDHPENMNYREHIKGLTLYALENNYNISPLPKVIFVNNDLNNSDNFLGKTAYYNPADSSIVIYTFGRDPIAIVNSYSHELIHHIQNIENRLEGINTVDTLESSHLEEIEREAYEEGGLLLRNYKDSLRKQNALLEGFEINEDNINFTQLENELDAILEPLGLDAEFTKHFKERCIDRNLSDDEIVELVSKVVSKYGNDVADLKKGENRVFSDIRRLVDLATVVGSYNDDYLKDIIFKTAYKRNSINEPEFRTNNTSPKLKVAEDKFGLGMFMRELVKEITEDTPKYEIFCDMDGVLTDFDSRFLKYSKGIPPGEYENKMGKEAFWGLIDKKIGLDFWEKMEWMSDGRELWNYIKSYKPIVLSAPSRDPVSREGKQKWIKSNLPGTKLILAFSDQKKEYAKKNYILIDDRKKNIEDWISSGGIGILHTSTRNTIEQLKKLDI